MSLGDKLRELRENNNLTQQEVADKIKLSSSTVAMYERNQRDPDTGTLKDLANLFNVSTDYLLNNLSGLDDEYNELYNKIYNNPDLKIFFDQTKNLTVKDMKWVLSIVEKVKEEHEKNN